MSRRTDPYPVPGCIVRLPDPVWSAALQEVRRYATLGSEGRRRGSEALVYLGGVVAGDELLVTTLYCLDHEPQGDRVVVAASEARWLLGALRARDEKLIGQVHSHRGAAGHSLGDDLHATSFHDGFLSLVAPDFGHGVTTIGQCAVLEFRNGRFAELHAAEVQRRVRVDKQVVRPTSDAATPDHQQSVPRFPRRPDGCDSPRD